MKNETQKIAFNTGAQLIGKIISTVLGLTAVFIMTRALGPEKYGWYATATGFLQFIGIFIDFGFTVVGTKMLSEPAFDKQKLADNLFTWRLITALISQGILPFCIFFFPYPIEIKMAVMIMSASFISVSLNQIFVAKLQTQGKIYHQAIGEVLGRIALVIGIIFTVQKTYGFLPMMTAITIAALIYSVYIWLNSRPHHLSIDWEISKAIYKKIWPTAVSVFFNCIYLQGDRFLLPLYVSQVENGYYNASYRVLDILVQIIAMIIGIIMPFLTYNWSHSKADEFKKYFQRAFDLTSLIMMPMIFGIFGLATPIMILVAGKEFAPSGAILSLLIWAIFATTYGMIFGHIVLAIDQQKKSLWAYIIAAIVGLASYLILIPHLGIWGAAYTTIISETIATIILAFIAIRYSGVKPQFRALIKIIISCLIMLFTTYLLRGCPVVMNIMLSGLVYVVAILSMHTISTQTLKEIFLKKTS